LIKQIGLEKTPLCLIISWKKISRSSDTISTTLTSMP
jgi:hypothetical protein